MPVLLFLNVFLNTSECCKAHLSAAPVRRVPVSYTEQGCSAVLLSWQWQADGGFVPQKQIPPAPHPS